MNLDDDVDYRRLRLGPLHQPHSCRSRSLIRHHDRFHGPPPCARYIVIGRIPFVDNREYDRETRWSRSLWAIAIDAIDAGRKIRGAAHDRVQPGWPVASRMWLCTASCV